MMTMHLSLTTLCHCRKAASIHIKTRSVRAESATQKNLIRYYSHEG